MNSVVNTINKRRSRYALKNELPISEDRLRSMIENIVEAMPTQMNSQSSRVFVLMGADHEKFWDITLDELQKVTPAEFFSKTLDKVNTGFKAGYGTVLYFEDQETIESLEESYPLYAHNFPSWSEQASGMLQMTVWSALAEEGIGASLQHYTELIDDSVKAQWQIPQNWKMLGQMPFGIAVDVPGSKQGLPIESRVIFHK